MIQTEKIILFLSVFLAGNVLAQKPREIQVDNAPPYWEHPATIITLIVIPLIMIIFGIVWYRRRQRKIREIKDRLDKDQKEKRKVTIEPS